MRIKAIENPVRNQTVYARVPELADVENLQVGDLAPTAFGGLSEVTRIIYRGVDVNGKAYVGYMAAMSESDTPENGCGCSNSMKVGELMRSVALTGLLTSAECDALEAELRCVDDYGNQGPDEYTNTRP